MLSVHGGMFDSCSAYCLDGMCDAEGGNLKSSFWYEYTEEEGIDIAIH